MESQKNNQTEASLVKQCVDSNTPGWIRGVGVEDITYLEKLCSDNKTIDGQESDETKSQAIIRQNPNIRVNRLSKADICNSDAIKNRHSKIKVYCEEKYRKHDVIGALYTVIQGISSDFYRNLLIRDGEFKNIFDGTKSSAENIFKAGNAILPGYQLNYIAQTVPELMVGYRSKVDKRLDTISNSYGSSVYPYVSEHYVSSIPANRWLITNASYVISTFTKIPRVFTIDLEGNVLINQFYLRAMKTYDFSDYNDILEIYENYITKMGNVIINPLKTTVRISGKGEYRIVAMIKRYIRTNAYRIYIFNGNNWISVETMTYEFKELGTKTPLDIFKVSSILVPSLVFYEPKK